VVLIKLPSVCLSAGTNRGSGSHADHRSNRRLLRAEHSKLDQLASVRRDHILWNKYICDYGILNSRFYLAEPPISSAMERRGKLLMQGILETYLIVFLQSFPLMLSCFFL